MRITMTLLVRDAEELIVANLEHHFALGVEHVIVTDNLSVDRTVELVQPYVEQERVTLIHEPRDDYSQSLWVTKMARMAHARGADWVINNDDDEFWWPQGGDLKGLFSEVPPEIGALSVERHNFVGVEPIDLPFWERMLWRETPSLNLLGDHLPGKVCHRAHPHALVHMGNHGVDGLGEPVRESSMEIWHVPVRSREQLQAKIRVGGEALTRNTELHPEMVRTWRRLYAGLGEGAVERAFENVAMTPERASAAIAAGTHVYDTRLRDRLRAVLGRR